MRSVVLRAVRVGLPLLLALGLFALPAGAGTDSQVTVYITKTGKKYHRESCSSLRKSKIKTTLAEAKEQGYGACKNCSPPT